MSAYLRIKKLKYDDLIFFDNDQLLTEATTSNVFLINQTNQIITPPVSSTVLSGILRLKLIEYLNLKGLKVWEKEISREEFLEARSIFLTNSIKGIRIINKIDEKLFEKSLILENILNEFGRYGDKIR
jgi:branched-subunit amino acid aminotransferase/4-amino-4-deoxychorismate lyase